VIAVAVRVWDILDSERLDVEVLFFKVEKDCFKKKKEFTIKVTEDRIDLSMTKSIDRRLSIVSMSSSSKPFPRYVQSMDFSMDGKYFVLCLRNGPR